MRILIVEDEVLIAELIKGFLEEKEHQITQICISYEEAVAAYRRSRPDLVLLDIRLFGTKSGIDVGRFLANQPDRPPFVYLTAQYDRRIFQLAQETHPYGYLTKPIQKTSLWTTIETAYRLYQRELSKAKGLQISDGQRNYRVREEEIMWIQSDHVYARVHLESGGEIVTRKPLRNLSQELRLPTFFQCHRSYIINIRYILNWSKEAITLRDGAVIPVSRSKKAALQQLLGAGK